MKTEKFVQTRIKQYYWKNDLNCATATLRILSEKFSVPLNEQVIDAALGMHGAGCYGAQCGLVEGAVMFLGIIGRMNNIDDEDSEKICRNFARQFDNTFDSLLCRELRPGDFNDDDPPHLCEPHSNQAILFSIDFVEKLHHKRELPGTGQQKDTNPSSYLIDSTQCTIPIRKAEISDIPTLALHHRKMFQEIWDKKGSPLDEQRLGQVEQAYAEKLTEQFSDESCTAWVAVQDDTIVASGAVTIISFVPTPLDLSHQLGYLHSLYTEEEYRGKQCAHKIIDQVIDYCNQKGIRRIILTASEEGRPIYHAIGFRSTLDLMRLVLE